MNKLNRLYVAMLGAWKTVVKDDYSLCMVIDNQEFPILVDSKKTYLPTDVALDTNTTDKVFFHPACESIISGETDIFKVIRKLSCMTLLQAFTRYPTVLFAIAGKKSSKSMRSDALEIIEPLRELTQAQQKEVHELLNQMTVKLDDETLDKRFVHFAVKKGGKSHATGGKVYYRVQPQFPFYSEMSRRLNRSEELPRNQKVEVNGFKITLKALEAAVHIFRSVFPSIDTPDRYSGESLKSDAARLVAYCESYALVADDLNTLQNLFRSDFDKANVYGLETSFTEDLENISEIYRQVPALPHNNQSSNETGSLARTNNLIDSVVNTDRDHPSVEAVYGTQQPVHHTPQSAPQGNDPSFINVVQQSMTPGEAYQGGGWDAGMNCFVHYTMGPHGQVIYKITRSGLLMQREQNNMMPQGYAGYAGYYNQMQQGGIPGMIHYQQPQQPQYSGYAGAMPNNNVQPAGFNNSSNGVQTY